MNPRHAKSFFSSLSVRVSIGLPLTGLCQGLRRFSLLRRFFALSLPSKEASIFSLSLLASLTELSFLCSLARLRRELLFAFSTRKKTRKLR